jgi:methionyl aminopeptidase
MVANPGARILRSAREIGKMRRAGLLVWQSHQAAARLIRPGVTTGELDAAIAEVFRRNDALPLFLGYPGKTPFPAVSCISINEEVVHGIPGDRQIREGDIVSIDTGCKFDGWCGDAALTHPVGKISGKARKLLEVTSDALNVAFHLMGQHDMWSSVALEMQTLVEAAGFSVVRSMVGHAIGQEMHESPQVPNYFDPEWVTDEDFALRPGVVLAVEPMVNIGGAELSQLNDHWTTVTRDHSLSAHFEHTIAITRDGPRRLTGPPETDEEFESLPDWLHDASKWVGW